MKVCNLVSDKERRRRQYSVYVKEVLTKYQIKFGGVAQLGEHLPCKQGVRSSILLISTNPNREVRIEILSIGCTLKTKQ